MCAPTVRALISNTLFRKNERERCNDVDAAAARDERVRRVT